MVKEFDDETVISSVLQDIQSQLSLKRWLKHIFYFKSSKKLFNAEQTQQITDAVTQAEHGHRGEIKVIIEGSLPSHVAFEMDSKQRAEQLFAHYRVWDTEYNSGMLIYLNLCSHAVEIVVDRGIDQAVQAGCWDEICQSMLPYFKQGQFTEGLCIGIEQLGQRLKDFYGNDQVDPENNELPNMPKLL